MSGRALCACVNPQMADAMGSDGIEHRPGCERPVLPTGVGYTCDCASRSAQQPDLSPSPREREIAHRTWANAADADEWADALARYRVVLNSRNLVVRRECALLLEREKRILDLLQEHDGNAPPSAYRTIERIRAALIGG